MHNGMASLKFNNKYMFRSSQGHYQGVTINRKETLQIYNVACNLKSILH